jgi:hypothetical protein
MQKKSRLKSPIEDSPQLLTLNQLSNHEKKTQSLSRGYNPKVDSTYATGDYIKNIDMDDMHQRRAGVIVYSVIDGKLMYCMGVDNVWGQISDFGGGVRKEDKNVVTAALREFFEETLGVFGIYFEDEVQDCFCIFSEVMFIMFIHLDMVDDVSLLFDQRRSKFLTTEMRCLKWLSHKDFINYIESSQNELFHRVQKLLSYYIQSHKDFIDKL